MATYKVYMHKMTHMDDLIALNTEMNDHIFICVGSHEFEFEIPADFDPIAAEIAAKKAAIKDIHAESQLKITRLESRINDLLAISYSPTVTSSPIDDNANEVTF